MGDTLNETMESIWERAPEEATHYTPETGCYAEAFWRITDGLVRSVWVKHSTRLEPLFFLDQGYSRLDYPTDNVRQPHVPRNLLIERPNEEKSFVVGNSPWLPGDRVWYKDKSSLDTAWDQPVLMTVVLEKDGLVWVKDELEDKLVFSHELSAFTEEDYKKKSTLATLYALLNQTSLSREEIGEVSGVLLEAGVTFDKEKRDDIG